MAFAGTKRFELCRQLGRGGMGVVHEAYDHVRGMRVAIKTLRRLDANGLLRFKREFRALSNLSHPNIVHLYELVSEGHDWFFTMEFVDGHDLVSYVRGTELEAPPPASRTPGGPMATDDTMVTGPDGTWMTQPDLLGVDGSTETTPAPADAPAPEDLPAPASLPALDDLLDRVRLWDAMGQLAGALCALHNADMVHCDLKPSNIMVTHEGRVVLMDFGVVAATRWSHDLVRLNEAEGTPAFMAPEQARGEPPSAAADWYAFGATLYLLLAGRLPFDSDSLQILMDKQEMDPVPPSTFTRDIPPALEALCMRLLQRDAAARPRGSEVLAALDMRPAEDRPAPRPGRVPGDAPLFVGRAAELDVLRQSYEAAQKGQMRYVLLDGPSGMGKTSLLGRFLQELREDHAGPDAPLVLMARCRERESLAYKAFDGLIDQLSLHLQDMPVHRRRALLPEGAALLTRLFPVLRRVKELDITTQLAGGMELRLQAMRVLRALLDALGRERPVVACIDDLQWADRDSFDLLDGLLAPPAPAGLLLLATVRSESLRLEDAPALSQLLATLSVDAAGRRITLGPLSAAEQGALVAHLATRGGQRAAIDEVLVQESAGHPMLLAELARYAEDDPDELATAGALHLEDVIWRRVMRLPAAARALIEALAIAGEPTPLDVLAAAADLSPADRERALSTARTSHLARVTRSGAAPRPEPWADPRPASRAESEPWPESWSESWIDVYHDKVREAVAERLAPERVQALHGRLARAMDTWAEAPAASLARHWLAAGERDRAAEHLLRAARDAAEQLAFDRAAALYRSVANVLADLPGDPARDRRRCQAWLGLAQGMRLADRTDEAMALLERADVAAAVHGWCEELADIHYLRGNLLFLRHDLDGCLEQHARARIYAREIDSPRREAAALGGLGDAHYLRGQFTSAHEHYARCIDLCRQHGFEDIEAANLPMRGLMRFYYCDIDAAVRDGTAAAALAARVGHLRAEIVATMACLGQAWRELGWEDSMRAPLEHARELARSLGSRRLEASVLATLARLLALGGQQAEAEDLSAESRALLRGIPRSFTNVLVLSAAAVVTRDRDMRNQALTEAEALVAAGTLSGIALSFHRDAMEIALADGDYERVERQACALEELTREEPLPLRRFVVARARALAAHGQGRRDAALVEEMQRLFREGRAQRFVIATEALSRALAEAGAAPAP